MTFKEKIENKIALSSMKVFKKVYCKKGKCPNCWFNDHPFCKIGCFIDLATPKGE